MSNRSLILTLLLVLLSWPLVAMGEQISAEQSVARLMRQPAGRHAEARAEAQRLTLVHTSATKEHNRYYIFARPQAQGYLILAADDLLPLVLADVPLGQFEPSLLPPALQSWLQDCDARIDAALSTGTPLTSSLSYAADRADIEPMLTTTWGQGFADGEEMVYNTECPMANGQHCATGCVATAMAQIMNYHMWPRQGKGQTSYQSLTPMRTMSVSVDFSKGTYDWAAMQDHYGLTYAEDGSYRHEPFEAAARDAVGLLMFHCGAAVRTNYGLPSEGGSGANNYVLGAGMVKHFGYDVGTVLEERLFYSDAQWDAIVYSDLAARRPILYCAATVRQEGHAFVCDGYRQGLYHINWGWNGLSDGYYAILGGNALNPPLQGTGGAASRGGFSEGHTILTGIQPPVEGSTPNYRLGALGKYTITDHASGARNKLYEQGYAHISCVLGMFNNGNDVVEVQLSLKLVDTTTGTSYQLPPNAASYASLDQLSGVTEFYANCLGVPDGKYKAYPTFRVKGETTWRDMLIPQSIEAPTVTYSGSTMGLTTPTTEPLSAPAYDLSGRPASATTGLIIQRGTKRLAH